MIAVQAGCKDLIPHISNEIGSFPKKYFDGLFSSSLFLDALPFMNGKKMKICSFQNLVSMKYVKKPLI